MRFGFFKYLVMALASIFNFFMPVSMAINPDCDYYQDVLLGATYYIYNQEYPSYYGVSTSCRWVARSDIGTKIVVSCDVEIPTTTSCSGDRLAISLAGYNNLTDSKNYCGQGSVSLVSNENALTVGLFSASNSPGGRFLCTLTSIIDTSNPTTPQPSVCDCGWRKETRIVGGEETKVNEFPSMAGLVDTEIREVYCGSSIISDRYVLTAAHCLTNRDKNLIGVLVGDHNLSTGADTAAAVLHKVSEFVIHSNYNSDTFTNDVAIVQTLTKIVFNMYVGPVCLPFRYSSFDFVGQIVTALGWGQLEFSGPLSDTLQKVNLTVVSNAECAPLEVNPITPTHICTYAPGKDSCQSDSGGPLLWTDGDTRRLHLVGVISYGLGCATERPGVSSRVTSFLTWIISQTTDANYCIK